MPETSLSRQSYKVARQLNTPTASHYDPCSPVTFFHAMPAAHLNARAPLNIHLTIHNSLLQACQCQFEKRLTTLMPASKRTIHTEDKSHQCKPPTAEYRTSSQVNHSATETYGEMPKHKHQKQIIFMLVNSPRQAFPFCLRKFVHFCFQPRMEC